MSTFSYHELLKDDLKNSPEFKVSNQGDLSFNGIDLKPILEKHGTPLKITYLPIISRQINKAKEMFNSTMQKLDYKGDYTYCYCTKSSHFSFVLKEVLNNGVHLETSSAYDIPIIESLYKSGHLSKDKFIVCNGFKRPEYTKNIIKLINNDFNNTIPILDNTEEFKAYAAEIKKPFKYGLRIATEEVPNFQFYTSRLGIQPKIIVDYYKSQLQDHPHGSLVMLHFFINTGIKDQVYYWNELAKCLKIYAELKKICPTLTGLNIGGGLPFKNKLDFDYNYEDFIYQILKEIKETCKESNTEEPNIFTEFGTYTVAEASANFYSVLDEKNQNDRESWYMIDNSFMTTLPDTWGIDQRFIILPINNWHNDYKTAFLGGLTCDSMDFYNADMHNNKLFMPNLDENKLYIGLFNTGAYQEALSGYGGIKHCLIPSPKHVVISREEKNELDFEVFDEEQSSENMLKTLGY